MIDGLLSGAALAAQVAGAGPMATILNGDNAWSGPEGCRTLWRVSQNGSIREPQEHLGSKGDHSFRVIGAMVENCMQSLLPKCHVAGMTGSADDVTDL